MTDCLEFLWEAKPQVLPPGKWNALGLPLADRRMSDLAFTGNGGGPADRLDKGRVPVVKAAPVRLLSSAGVDVHVQNVRIIIRRVQYADRKSRHFPNIMSQMDFAQRVTMARHRVGMTMAQAAELIGCSRPLLAQWESGRSKSLGGKYLLGAARAYKVNPEWLAELTDEDGYPWDPSGRQISKVSETETPPGYLRFDLYEGAAGMGPGVINQDYPEVVRTLEVAEWEVRRKLGFLPRPGRIQIITGRGPSMRPKIEDGDVVWIDTACDYFDGDDYYLINIEGETSIKMLQRRSDGIYVVSVNPEFPAWRPDPESLQIKGRALVHAGFRRF